MTNHKERKLNNSNKSKQRKMYIRQEVRIGGMERTQTYQS